VAATLLLDPPLVPASPSPRSSSSEEEGGPLAPRPTPVPPSAPVAAPAAPAAPVAAPARAPAVTPTAPVASIAASSPRAPAVEPTTLHRAGPSLRARRPSRIELELHGIVDGAPVLGDATVTVTGGGALRLAVGGRYLAGTLGVAGLAPSGARAADVDVEVTRIPFDAGLRLVLPRDRFEAGADLGLVLAILRVSAPALRDADTSTRLDAGARVAGWLRLWVTRRLALQLGVQLGIPFAAYDLVVQPAGKIGTTPRLWVGGGLGLAVRL
jgi:hypothetical protein